MQLKLCPYVPHLIRGARPLLFIGKFYLPPFHIKLEKSVEIATENAGTIIKGRIDFLLLNEQF
jgi:hypothetical protein